MTIRVKIIGAGSIGNHLAHGCRSLGMSVTLVDIDEKALDRARKIIYPGRYGSWDKDITLSTPAGVAGEDFDVVIVGTPPSTHLEISTAELQTNSPKILLIEKPLSHPSKSEIEVFARLAARTETRVLVGYNQRLKLNTVHFLEKAKSLQLGELKGLRSSMLESWDGILKAHFWMSSEKDSYLARTRQGGGALMEHSHALNLFLYFAKELGQGSVAEVSGKMVWVEREDILYDSESILKLTLESGLVGTVAQDLHTWPPRKEAAASFEGGVLVWGMADSADYVELRTSKGETLEMWNFPKSRPDDFIGELVHLGDILSDPQTDSPIDFRYGLEVMDVILAAFESSKSGKPEPVQKRE